MKKTIFSRLLKYCQKVFNVEDEIAVVKDKRIKPQIQTSTVLKSVLAMGFGQQGSLNALEQSKESGFWDRWLGVKMPSADTIGRVMGVVDNEDIRQVLKSVYLKMKRNKALKPLPGNKVALIIDGHEVRASYLRHCSDCLERKTKINEGEEMQYYHRIVSGMLLVKGFAIPIDIEEQRRGEDEVAAATRMLERIFKNYPKAFQIILTDGLYPRAGFFELALKHKKDVIAVLKDERRDLLQDARGMFKWQEPNGVHCEGKTTIKYWDMEGFSSWDTLKYNVRVVRTIEETIVKRQKDKKEEIKIVEWIWVGTITRDKLSSENFIKFGHYRWAIENQGFNELTTYWHADHVYKHDTNAINGFWLMTMLAYIIFHAFLKLNLKSHLRNKYSKLHFLRLITAEIYFMNTEANALSPP